MNSFSAVLLIGFLAVWSGCSSEERENETEVSNSILQKALNKTKVLSDSLGLDSIQRQHLHKVHLKLENAMAALLSQKDKMDKRVFKNELRKVILFTENSYKEIFTAEQYEAYKRYRMRKSINKNRMIRLKKKPETNHPD